MTGNREALVEETKCTGALYCSEHLSALADGLAASQNDMETFRCWSAQLDHASSLLLRLVDNDSWSASLSEEAFVNEPLQPGSFGLLMSLLRSCDDAPSRASGEAVAIGRLREGTDMERLVPFENRRAAGRALARLLIEYAGQKDVCREVGREADRCICAIEPVDFRAVGYWYEDFSEVYDTEVLDLLRKARTYERAS